MKKNKGFVFVLIIFCVSVSMAAFDKDKPASSTSLRNSNPEILANWSALETALDQDHDFSTGGTQTGTHDQIKFTAPISTPSNAANVGFLYTKDVSAVVEFHWEDESGNELQMTSGGGLFSSTSLEVTTTLTVTGESTFNNHVNLGGGDDLIGSATSDITFNTDKFTVAGATGNTVIAGTCDITGATEVTGVATIGDGSLLKTSAAPSTDAMIANKKYVDDNVGSANWTPTSYAGEESVTFPNGLIFKQGLKTRTGTNTTVTFAEAFSTVTNAWATGSGGTDAFDVQVTTLNTTTLVIKSPNANASPFRWFAIGY